MFDLRFVEREVPDWPEHVVYGEPCKMKKVKILQWRQVRNVVDVANDLQSPIWTLWTDVPTEEEEP
jgi:hypothetical protein